jgi:DNA-binding XRE family transcriptional regulator
LRLCFYRFEARETIEVRPIVTPAASQPAGPSGRRILSGRQCAAARAAVGWTQARLSDEAAVARKTIADFEAGLRIVHHRTRRKIMDAFERAGVAFVPGGIRFEGRGG